MMGLGVDAGMAVWPAGPSRRQSMLLYRSLLARTSTHTFSSPAGAHSPYLHTASPPSTHGPPLIFRPPISPTRSALAQLALPIRQMPESHSCLSDILSRHSHSRPVTRPCSIAAALASWTSSWPEAPLLRAHLPCRPLQDLSSSTRIARARPRRQGRKARCRLPKIARGPSRHERTR